MVIYRNAAIDNGTADVRVQEYERGADGNRACENGGYP
jgi:hypothetical protein